MANPLRGEVWLVDLGMVAKIRPCLIVSVPATGPNDRVLATVVAHTTSARGSAFEVAVPARFLKPGVFDAQNIISIPHVKLVRRLGMLTPEQMETVAAVACLPLLGLLAWYSTGFVHLAKMRAALLDSENTKASAERLRELARYRGGSGYEIDNRVASNPSTPPDVLRSLHGRPDQVGTEMCLAENPNAG